MIKVLFFCLYCLYSAVAFSAETTQTTQTTQTNQTNQTNQSQVSHIRVLASSCAACHGTHGNSVGITPTLAGLNVGYFVTQMLAFKLGERSSTVMHHHAKGLTEEEIQSLANYFASQPRVSPVTPPSEQLKARHGH